MKKVDISVDGGNGDSEAGDNLDDKWTPDREQGGWEGEEG